jgi:hypothetical protein
MRRRCSKPNRAGYKNYGGRGITVCPEWDNAFVVFYNWAMDNGYNDNLTIERVDVNRGYCPGNCKWIPKSLQNHNLRTTLKISAFGILKDAWWWSEKTGLRYNCIRDRITYCKMSAEQALLKGNTFISASTIRNNLIKSGILKEEQCPKIF